jgi:hypothetical protein
MNSPYAQDTAISVLAIGANRKRVDRRPHLGARGGKGGETVRDLRD